MQESSKRDIVRVCPVVPRSVSLRTFACHDAERRQETDACDWFFKAPGSTIQRSILHSGTAIYEEYESDVCPDLKFVLGK